MSGSAAAAAAVGINNVTHLIALLAQVSIVNSTIETANLSTAADDHGFNDAIDGDARRLLGDALALTAITTKPPDFDDVRPVTLSSQWSRLGRLLLISCLSVVGSVGNVFMVSSVMIEEQLNKAGNAFIVNVALADLLVTSISMPITTIVLLAGIDEPLLAVCQVQWFLATCAFLVTVSSLACSTIENYLRLCTPQDRPSFFNRRKTTFGVLLIWMVCSVAAGLQFVFDINEFDYCTRSPNNNVPPYQSIIVSTLILLPLVLTFFGHIRIFLEVRRFVSRPNYKPSLTHTWDQALVRTNFFSFVVFVVFWLPFGVVLAYHTTTAPVPNRVFYTTAWIGLSKSCINNLIYCVANRHFRNAYVNLFHYCCCKTTVSVSRRQRIDMCRPSSDVRVHIIPGYNMYSYTSPQRNANVQSKRDVHEL